MRNARDIVWDCLEAHPRLRSGYLWLRSWSGVPFQPAAIARYLSTVESPRLHLGAGRNVLPGWLNTDYLGHFPGCLRLDVRKRFPFPDASFEFIFSEHMIEHIMFGDGLHMLAECRRVLKPGGVIRVETPDLRFISSLYDTPLDEGRKSYVEFHIGVFKSDEAPSLPCVAINNAMRHWGHRFIYDEETLRKSLALAGFTAAACVSTGESTHKPLAGMRSRDWLPTNELETLAMEAVKAGIASGRRTHG